MMAAENEPPKSDVEDKSDKSVEVQDREKGIDFVTLGMFIIGGCFFSHLAPLAFVSYACWAAPRRPT